MMEINFCPFCDAPGHKVVRINDTLSFCKDCNKFFELDEKKFECFKCGSHNFEDSDFPTPSGEMVLQCKKCKKMYSLTEFFKKTEEVTE
jgi:predicted nucleic-acid-binding Zn-ribbon protein